MEHDLASIAGEWDELAARTHALPWSYAGHLAAWWTAFGTGRLELLTLRRGGELVGAVALQRQGRRSRSPTNSESSDFELVAADADARQTLADAVFALSAGPVELERLPAEGDDIRACRSAASTHGYRCVERSLERSPYLELHGDFESYFRSRSKNLVDSLRRRRRRLAEEGTVAFEVADGRERLDELLSEGYRLEGSGWKAEQATAIGSRPDARRFYDLFAAWAAERGTLRLAFLLVDERAVAFQLALEHDGVFYFCKAGYDPAYHRFSPGTQLVALLLERAFELGLARVEFLGADEPWKLEWAESVRELRTFQAFSSAPLDLAAWAAERWGRPAARRLRVRRLLSPRLG